MALNRSMREKQIHRTESGIKVAEFETVGGKVDGLFKQWSAEGSLRIEAEYMNGELHGSYNSWWPNGAVMETGFYREGQKEGIYRWFKESGELWSEHDYG